MVSGDSQGETATYIVMTNECPETGTNQCSDQSSFFFSKEKILARTVLSR